MEQDTNERVRALEAQLATTQERVQHLEAERAIEPVRAGRRNFLKLAAAGAAVGTALAVGSSASPAAASSGSPLLIGAGNNPTSTDDLTTLSSPSASTLSRSLLWVKNYSLTYSLVDLNWRTAIVGNTADVDASSGFRIGVVGEVSAFSDNDKKGIGVLGMANRPEVAGLPIINLPTTPIGVLGFASAQGASGSGTAVKGFVNDGSSTIGVHGATVNTVGVQAEATASGGVGLHAIAPNNAIAAQVAGRLRQVPAASPGAPSFSPANIGEQWRDSNGDLWICVTTGTPGTWRKVVAQHPNFPTAGGSVNFLLNPIRLLDTRPSGTAPASNGHNPLTANVDLQIDIATISVGGVQVPSGATGIIGNLTALPLTSNGFMTLWAENVAQPGTSNINFRAGINVANSFVCALSPAGKVRLRSSVATNALLDVVGFLY